MRQSPQILNKVWIPTSCGLGGIGRVERGCSPLAGDWGCPPKTIRGRVGGKDGIRNKKCWRLLSVKFATSRPIARKSFKGAKPALYTLSLLNPLNSPGDFEEALPSGISDWFRGQKCVILESGRIPPFVYRVYFILFKLPQNSILGVL